MTAVSSAVSNAVELPGPVRVVEVKPSAATIAVMFCP